MTGPRRFRLLMTTDAVGGVWQFSLDLARGLAVHGVETCLAVLGPAPSPAQAGEAAETGAIRLLPTGLPLDWTTSSEVVLAEATRSLALVAARERPDLVQLNHPAFAEGPWRVPLLAVVHSCHGSWWAAMRGRAPAPADFAWRMARICRALARADRVVAPSASLARVLQQIYAPPRGIVTIRNGRTPAAGTDVGTAPAGPFVLTAGRLWDEAKNVAAIDAAAPGIAAPVRAAGPLTGPNGERVALHNVVACGSLDSAAMAAHLAAARVFVSAARYEPFGLAVLEAAQAGRPLVLSDIPTFRELWDGAALFAPADRPPVFARLCSRLLEQPDEAAGLGAAAARRARRYSREAMVAGYLDAYAGLLTAPSRRLAG